MRRLDCFYSTLAAAMKAALFGMAGILVLLAATYGSSGTAAAKGETGTQNGKPIAATTPSATVVPTCMPAPAVVSSPNRPGFNELYGAAAFSPADVWSVGTYKKSGFAGSFTLIEHWDGAQWNVIDSPNPTPTPGYT